MENKWVTKKMSVVTAMKARPEVRPKYALTTFSKSYKMLTSRNELKWQYNDNKLVRSIDECLEDGNFKAFHI